MNIDCNVCNRNQLTLHSSLNAITDRELLKIIHITEYGKLFERLSYQGVFIIDCFENKFIYVSKNIARLCGESVESFIKSGYNFYIRNIPESEFSMFAEITHKAFEFFHNLPINERCNYTISYNINVKWKSSRKRIINHKLTPLSLSSEGYLRFAVCVISLASGSCPGSVIMKKTGDSFYYEYSFERHQWIRKTEVILTESERDVLTLSSQGYTMKEISEVMCKSVDTIKTYKRMIFQKMGVKNIVEALTYAQNHQIF